MRDWLSEIRKQKGYTQARVAAEAKISRAMYSMIEIGQRNPTVTNAKKIADVLEFEWTYFFDEKCHESRNNQKAKPA